MLDNSFIFIKNQKRLLPGGFDNKKHTSFDDVPLLLLESQAISCKGASTIKQKNIIYDFLLF